MRLRAAAISDCDEERKLTVTWSGNHDSVSATCSALVPHTQMRYHL
jgi:hypothetical protein